MKSDLGKQLWDDAIKRKKKRAKQMPTVSSALSCLDQAYERLRELGFNDIIYCPKDGSFFDAIEAGSTGIHDCRYVGEWPNGRWEIHDSHDIWPARPILFKKKEVACQQ